MNTRIQELAEQAGSTHKQSLGVYQFYADELEDFAELIVRECAKIADKAWAAPGYQIKQHFGVEK